MKRFFGLITGLVLVCGITGCLKPFHENVYANKSTSEIFVMIDTVDDEGQAIVAPKMNDEEQLQYYKDHAVSSPKVLVPYYWEPSGREWLFYNGNWKPAVKIIAVDTQPETREWTSSASTGSTNRNQGIWVESSDSVGFSTGISITANIDSKDDAITFLNNYPPMTVREVPTNDESQPFRIEVTSLEQIMDKEVRTKVQEVFAYEANKYNMDELREKKNEILDRIREVVVPYFKEKGITITTIGQFGGFTYENPDIQKSIDKVFEAQQDEEVARAESKAAEQRKSALKLKGEGQAEQELEVARGKAEAVKLEALAEAEAIKQVADAKSYELEKLQVNPEAYFSLKKIEVEMERLRRWDGKYPNVMVNGGGEDGSMTPVVVPVPATK